MVNDSPVAEDTYPESLLEADGSESVDWALEGVTVLGRLVTLFAERRRQLGESVGLTDQQWQALEEVQTEHFMPSLFAKERDSSAAAVSKILRQLADKGLITAHVSDIDARHREYHVTARGREALEALREGRREAIREVWRTLDASELESFAKVGKKLALRLEEFTEQKRSDGTAKLQTEKN